MKKRKKSWYSLEAKGSDVAEVFIYDDIGLWGITAQDFANDLRALGEISTLKIRFNSAGGSVFEATAMATLIEELKSAGVEIQAAIDGVAASMTSYLTQLASPGKITIAANGYFMVHNPTAVARGDLKQLDAARSLLEKATAAHTRVLAARSGKSEEDVAAEMDAETWFLGQEAVDAGYADAVTEAIDMAACATGINLSGWGNVPESLSQLLGGGEAKPRQSTAKRKPKHSPSAVADNEPSEQEPIMDPKKKSPGAAAGGGNEPTADELKAQAIADYKAEQEQRRTDIAAAFTGFEDDHDELLSSCLDDEQCDVDKAKDKLLAAINAAGKKQKPAHSYSIRVVEGQGMKTLLAHAENAICVRAGCVKELEDGNELVGYSLFEMARRLLEARGIATGSMSKLDLVGAAFTHTSSDFAKVLSNSANKAMLKGYEEVEEVFIRFAGVGNLPDFKELPRVDTGSFPSLRQVKAGAEYKYITMGERAESAILATYGELFSITRQAIINDDLGAFTRIPRKMGGAAVRTVGDLVFDVFLNNPAMADGTALFHAGHGNLAPASPINTAGLDAARVKMGTQKDGEATLNIRPKYLLVGTQDKAAATVAVESEFEVDAAAKNSRQPNAVRGIAEVLDDARLTAGHNSWYLLADQNMHDTIEVLYLDGNSAPVLEQMQGWNIDGTEFKVRIDAAAKAWDSKGMVKTPKP